MADKVTGGDSSTQELVVNFLKELVTSPLNLALLGVCGFLLYKILSGKKQEAVPPPEPQLPKMKKRDFTLEQLREYDGKGKDGRLLMAVNGKVFDVTRGKRFYGPSGPYGVFAGRDASRGLATFSLSEEAIKDEYDDLADLNSMQMDSIREWEMQFTEKYDYIGRLLKPGDQPQDYSDTEDEPSTPDKKEKSTHVHHYNDMVGLFVKHYLPYSPETKVRTESRGMTKEESPEKRSLPASASFTAQDGRWLGLVSGAYDQIGLQFVIGK